MFSFILLLSLASSYHVSALPQAILEPVPIGGGIVGGFSEVDGAADEAVVDFARRELDSRIAHVIGGGPDRCVVKIFQVQKFETQVVAGTNYRLMFTVGCRGDLNPRLQCEEVVVFQPLPHACRQVPVANNQCGDSVDAGNSRCLSVTGDIEEKCRLARVPIAGPEPVPAPLPPRPVPVIEPAPTLVGGYQDAEQSEEVLEFMRAQLEEELMTTQGCSAEIFDVDKFETQLVAGTNYRMTLKARCRGSDGKAHLSCPEMVVFQPLPHACREPEEGNPNCLSLTSDVARECRMLRG